jgi:hypothetical protein
LQQVSIPVSSIYTISYANLSIVVNQSPIQLITSSQVIAERQIAVIPRETASSQIAPHSEITVTTQNINSSLKDAETQTTSKPSNAADTQTAVISQKTVSSQTTPEPQKIASLQATVNPKDVGDTQRASKPQATAKLKLAPIPELHTVLKDLGYTAPLQNDTIDLSVLTPDEKAKVLACYGEELKPSDPFARVYNMLCRYKEKVMEQRIADNLSCEETDPGYLKSIDDYLCSQDYRGYSGEGALAIILEARFIIRKYPDDTYKVINRDIKQSRFKTKELTGLSKVGNLRYLIYYSIRLLAKNTIIIFHTENSCYCFSSNAIRSGASNAFQPLLNDKPIWYFTNNHDSDDKKTNGN